MKNALLLVLTVALCITMSCKPEPKEETQPKENTEAVAVEDNSVKDVINARENVDWKGMYTAILPCPQDASEDCDGIRYNITLNSDNTYELISYPIHETAKRTVKVGTIMWDESGSSIELTTEAAGSSTKYKVRDGNMVMLNEDGTDREYPEKYRLTKL